MGEWIAALLNGLALGGMLGYAVAMHYTLRRVQGIADRLNDARQEIARLELLNRLRVPSSADAARESE